MRYSQCSHDIQFTCTRGTWKLRYDVLVLVLLGYLGLSQLGFWQLTKARALIEQPSDNTLHVLSSSILDQAASSWRGKTYTLPLAPAPHKTILLENQPKDGLLGYRVLTAIPHHQAKILILVDRGWLAAPPSRQTLPEVPALTSPAVLTGQLYAPWQNPFISTPSDQVWSAEAQVIRLQSLDLDYLERLWHHPFARAILKLAPDPTGKLAYLAAEQKLNPKRHQGYAFQWFGLALTLFLASMIAGFRRKRDHD